MSKTQDTIRKEFLTLLFDAFTPSILTTYKMLWTNAKDKAAGKNQDVIEAFHGQLAKMDGLSEDGVQKSYESKRDWPLEDVAYIIERVCTSSIHLRCGTDCGEIEGYECPTPLGLYKDALLNAKAVFFMRPSLLDDRLVDDTSYAKIESKTGEAIAQIHEAIEKAVRKNVPLKISVVSEGAAVSEGSDTDTEAEGGDDASVSDAGPLVEEVDESASESGSESGSESERAPEPEPETAAVPVAEPRELDPFNQPPEAMIEVVSEEDEPLRAPPVPERPKWQDNF